MRLQLVLRLELCMLRVHDGLWLHSIPWPSWSGHVTSCHCCPSHNHDCQQAPHAEQPSKAGRKGSPTLDPVMRRTGYCMLVTLHSCDTGAMNPRQEIPLIMSVLYHRASILRGYVGYSTHQEAVCKLSSLH